MYLVLDSDDILYVKQDTTQLPIHGFSLKNIS